MDINLKALELESRWPRLAKLQAEIAGLSKRHREAEAQVQMLRNALRPAREKDLNTAAAAIRAGKDPAHGVHEADAKRQLEAAEKTSAIVGRAIESARTDYGTYLAQHRGELFTDILEARQKIAQEISVNAQAALSAFSRHEDLAYTLKGLAPAPPTREGESAQRLTQVVLGMATTQTAPARGDVEQILGYLSSLASGPSQGGNDAAA